MTKVRFHLFLALAIAVCFCASTPMAVAQPQPPAIHVLPATSGNHAVPSAAAPELFMLSNGFGALPPTEANGYNEWPCVPNPSNPNYADCSTIAAGGVVIGTPAYDWSYTACDDSSSTIAYCGQLFWFYQDDTGDNTDHLIVSLSLSLSLSAKQGTDYVFDVANYDLGPNPYPAGSVVVISENAAFGTLGATGKGNGFCYYSKETCVDPVPGIVNVTFTTKVGAQKITTHFNIDLQKRKTANLRRSGQVGGAAVLSR